MRALSPIPTEALQPFSLFQRVQSGLQEVGECTRTRAKANGKLQSAIKVGSHAQKEGNTRPKAQMPNPPLECGGAAVARIKHHEMRAAVALEVFVYALGEPK